MKRLPEQFDVSNAAETYLASLLQHVHPCEVSAEQRQRVWARLIASDSRRPRRRVSGPVVAGLLLCGATVASATMPHVWKRLHRATDEMTPSAPLAIEAPTSARRAPPMAPPVPIAFPEATDMAALADVPSPAPEPSAAARKSTTSRSHAPVAEPVDSLASGALMVEAIRERRAGNVARARELALQYRAKHPAGALHEEALALAVETAATLGDEEARQLAQTYLQRYPRGRFRLHAQRVIDNAR